MSWNNGPRHSLTHLDWSILCKFWRILQLNPHPGSPTHCKSTTEGSPLSTGEYWYYQRASVQLPVFLSLLRLWNRGLLFKRGPWRHSYYRTGGFSLRGDYYSRGGTNRVNAAIFIAIFDKSRPQTARFDTYWTTILYSIFQRCSMHIKIWKSSQNMSKSPKWPKYSTIGKNVRRNVRNFFCYSHISFTVEPQLDGCCSIFLGFRSFWARAFQLVWWAQLIVSWNFGLLFLCRKDKEVFFKK